MRESSAFGYESWSTSVRDFRIAHPKPHPALSLAISVRHGRWFASGVCVVIATRSADCFISGSFRFSVFTSGRQPITVLA